MDLEVTINDKKYYVSDQTTVFEACHQAGIYIPHFCYHPKLSIAANCRMCLVQIEKAPKPVPACATYVTDGMVVYTSSPAARAAQKGVMEFLLINHPLDCPICDQGGECQLQDLAVGYGSSCTRYGETKRVVVEKQLGPLITTVMTRCIHCTRCVRFGEEIAGQLELGMAGRGEHSEIMPFLEETVDSELSGNMIDICPVGALNSKPFRFSARTWELQRHDGTAQHDAWGSMLRIQTKENQIKRVLPREHEEINECWISDRDRFAYTGINVPTRCLEPYVLTNGASKPQPVEWSQALEFAATMVETTIKEHGVDQLGILLSPSLVSEEGMLAEEMLTALGGSNIDHRLRQTDFSLDPVEEGVPWLGCSIEELSECDHVFLIGANPAHELPLLPVRLRRGIAERTTKVSSLSARDLAGQLQLSYQLLAKPSQWVAELAKICAGLEQPTPWLTSAPAGEMHKQICNHLSDATAPIILLGEQAVNSAHYGLLRRLAALLARQIGGIHGILPSGANPVGLGLAGAIPQRGFMYRQLDKVGLNVAEMFAQPRKTYILIGCEPQDFANPGHVEAVLRDANVISIGSYYDKAREYADALLPGAVFAERRGATVNLEGNAATMAAAVNPPGQARPIWKILRVLGNMLGVADFEYDSLDEVRAKLIAAGDFATKLNNGLGDLAALGELDATATPPSTEFERILETAHYSIDPVVRRAQPLQDTVIAHRSHTVLLHPHDLANLGLAAGDAITVTTANTAISATVGTDDKLVPGCLRAPLGIANFAQLSTADTCEVAAAPVVAEATAA